MKPSSKNEVMNGIVNAYIAQKGLDKANNTLRRHVENP